MAEEKIQNEKIEAGSMEQGAGGEPRIMNKWLPWLIGLLVLGVVGYGGYYLGQLQNPNDKLQTNSKYQNTNVKTPTTPVVTPTPTTPDPTTPAKETDPTADWKTYENKEYGFSFKYPGDWEYKVVSSVQIELNEIGNKYNVEGSEIYSVGVFINNEASNSISELYNSMVSDLPKETSTSVEKTSYNSIQAITQKTYLQTQTYFLKNNKTIRFTQPNLGSNEINSKVKLVYDQILSTFKFTP